MGDTAPPVFIGGTGRCGTHALAALVAAGGGHAAIPAELRLHVAPTGLPAYVEGRVSRATMARRLRAHWWSHQTPWDPGTRRGAATFTPRRTWEIALARLRGARPGAPRAEVARRFVTDLLDSVASRAATPSWVEKSPDNCLAAARLVRLFPDARVIEIHRDGRDAACSLMGFPWAPDTFAEALAWWEQRMLASRAGMAAVAPEHRLTIALEDLVSDARERTLDQIAELTQPRDPAAQRRWFDRELDPARARIGRWRSDLPAAAHAEAEELYARSLERLGAPRPRPPSELSSPLLH